MKKPKLTVNGIKNKTNWVLDTAMKKLDTVKRAEAFDKQGELANAMLIKEICVQAILELADSASEADCQIAKIAYDMENPPKPKRFPKKKTRVEKLKEENLRYAMASSDWILQYNGDAADFEEIAESWKETFYCDMPEYLEQDIKAVAKEYEDEE